jgi:hypothetical protein
MSGTGSIWGHASVYQPFPDPLPDVIEPAFKGARRQRPSPR